jgi:predicted ATP-dependent Lon-type protease
MIEIQPKDTSKGHFYVSLAKSALRIIAGGSLLLGNLFAAGSLLILAEVLGIVEELV